MNAAPAQSVQIDWRSSHQGLAFAGRHLRDAAAMEDDSADELNVEMDHLPGRLVADRKGVLAIGKTASALLYDRECFGQNLLQTQLKSAGVGDPRELLFQAAVLPRRSSSESSPSVCSISLI